MSKVVRGETDSPVYVVENYRLPYFTITPTFSVCPDHSYLAGEHFQCPACGKDAEVWSRIVGYHRPVQNWNRGKKEEFKDRQPYRPGPYPAGAPIERAAAPAALEAAGDLPFFAETAYLC